MKYNYKNIIQFLVLSILPRYLLLFRVHQLCPFLSPSRNAKHAKLGCKGKLSRQIQDLEMKHRTPSPCLIITGISFITSIVFQLSVLSMMQLSKVILLLARLLYCRYYASDAASKSRSSFLASVTLLWSALGSSS